MGVASSIFLAFVGPAPNFFNGMRFDVWILGEAIFQEGLPWLIGCVERF